MRRILGILAAVAVAVIGGFIFGEQSFSGPVGAIIGGLLGFFVAEAAVLATGERSTFTAVVSAVFALAGTGLAVAIIGLVRVLDVVLPGQVWVVYVILGGIFTAAGLVLWSRRPKRRTAD